MEHQLSPVVAVSARYIRKWLIRAVEDTGSLDAAGNEIYIIANPGEGLTELAWVNPNVNQPKPKRDYDGVEFAITKNLSNNYFLRASYLWSRLWTATTRVSRSRTRTAAPARTSAARSTTRSCRSTRTPTRSSARSATDRPHQFKASFFYQTNFGMSFGLNGYFASGIPRTRELAYSPAEPLPDPVPRPPERRPSRHVFADGLPRAAGVQAGRGASASRSASTC